MLITSNATRPRNQRKLDKEIAARLERMAKNDAKVVAENKVKKA